MNYNKKIKRFRAAWCLALLTAACASIRQQEHSDKLDRLKATLSTLTDLQRDTIYKKFYRNMSNVDIAAEEGVSETAIRNRLKKIYAQLGKKI